MKKILNIIILGPQGSGKGTQAQLLADLYKLKHVETGNILRQIAKKKTPLGKKINKLINEQGRLVPSEFIGKILFNELKKLRPSSGVVIDGFPRNAKQAKMLDIIFKKLNRQITHVFYLPISSKTTVQRLSLRRTCQKCGRVFVSGKSIKKNATKCPLCSGQIYQRDDDKPKAIKKRLAQYRQLTQPIIKYYQKKKVLIKVDGELLIPKVLKEIKKYI